MKFYHYTGVEYLPMIARDGLTKGEVPLSQTKLENAVWLTTDINSEGHGLTDGGEIPPEILNVLIAEGKAVGGEVPRFADKRAVRFDVTIPSHDRKLVHWPGYARKRHVDPQWYEILNESGGGKAGTWWLYRGVITPEKLALFDRDGAPVSWWPEMIAAANT